MLPFALFAYRCLELGGQPFRLVLVTNAATSAELLPPGRHDPDLVVGSHACLCRDPSSDLGDIGGTDRLLALWRHPPSSHRDGVPRGRDPTDPEPGIHHDEREEH